MSETGVASRALLRAGCEERCPGCAHRGWPAERSECQKSDWLHATLSPWAKRIAALRTVTEQHRWGYRDRVRLHAEWREGAWRFGLLHDDELVPIPDCPVHSERVRRTGRALATRLPPHARFPLRYLVQSGGQVTLVLKSREEPPCDWIDDSLGAELRAAGVDGLWVHLHPSAGLRVFGKGAWRLAWGEGRSRDELGLRHGPVTFQQAIPALYSRALGEAEAFLAPRPGQTVVDLYCGNGATLQRWSRRGARVLGVELSGAAVTEARVHAPEAKLLQGRCAERLPQIAEWLGTSLRSEPDWRLYANPPRAGWESEVLDWVCSKGRPERIGYLSCSAGTLRRDLEVLTSAGYGVEALLPYDFLPQTVHVETLALLVRAT